MLNNEIIEKGYRTMLQSNLAICSIVRDCEKKLRKNIPIIEKVRSYFKSSIVIIFENDSKDQTKQILNEWSKKSSNVYVECENFGIKTITASTSNDVNKYFSNARITKMAEYRNQYLKKLEEINFKPDFVLVLDLDISKIYIEGILHSFGIDEQWDVVCANGYSLSPKLRRRYHDSYSLVELGKESIPQTEESIKENAARFSFLKKGQSLVPVYSAYGGLSIYRYEAIQNLRYRIIKNEDSRVEVRCEHFSFCNDVRKRGFNRIYINPELKLKYQSVDFNLIKKFIRNNFKVL